MSAERRVVVTDATFPDVAAEREAAERGGAAFVRAACDDAADVAEAVEGASVAVVQFAPLGREAIARLAPDATVIRYGVGYDNLDLAALDEHGVNAAYVPDYCTDEVADHTATCALALMRKLVPLDASVRRGEWSAVGVAAPMRPFADTVVGFVGFGRIARGVAARLRPFGMRFLVHDPFLDDDPAGDVRRAAMDELLAASDCVSLHAPSTEATRGMIDAAALGAMKPTAVLVNTARGDLVDEGALARALADGAIAGAALDVFAGEPLDPHSPLHDAPNLLQSPHAAWYSDAAVERLQGMVADEIGRALEGAPPRRPVPGTRAARAAS